MIIYRVSNGRAMLFNDGLMNEFQCIGNSFRSSQQRYDDVFIAVQSFPMLDNDLLMILNISNHRPISTMDFLDRCFCVDACNSISMLKGDCSMDAVPTR